MAFEACLCTLSRLNRFVSWHSVEIIIIPSSRRDDLYATVSPCWGAFKPNRVLALLSPPILTYSFTAMIGTSQLD